MRISRTRRAIEELRLLAFVLAAAAASATAAAQTPGTLAGKVELIEGEVRFLDRDRHPRTPKLDAPIYEGESIVTGANGEVHLKMEDGGLIAVRPDTTMRIVDFRAEGDENDKLTIGLLKGSFRSVTGWIAKFTRNNYTVRTTTATIGVRGTDHEPFQIPEGSTLGDPGTYDKVNQGATFLQTKYGRVDVTPGKAGFASLRARARPQVLARVPALFRPTRNEARITRQYKEIQQRLQQQRGERRKQVVERRKKAAAAQKDRPGRIQEQHGKPGAQHPEQPRKGGAAKQGEPRERAGAERELIERQRLERAQKMREAAEKGPPGRAAKERPAHREGRGERD